MHSDLQKSIQILTSPSPQRLLLTTCCLVQLGKVSTKHPRNKDLVPKAEVEEVGPLCHWRHALKDSYGGLARPSPSHVLAMSCALILPYTPTTLPCHKPRAMESVNGGPKSPKLCSKQILPVYKLTAIGILLYYRLSPFLPWKS